MLARRAISWSSSFVKRSESKEPSIHVITSIGAERHQERTMSILDWRRMCFGLCSFFFPMPGSIRRESPEGRFLEWIRFC